MLLNNQRKPFSPFIVEGIGNIQEKYLFQNMNSVSHNVVPHIPQISVVDVVTNNNVTQQPRKPLSLVIVERNGNVQDRSLFPEY